MPFYQWSESMSVGVALLDSERKALIETINQLHRAVQEAAIGRELLDYLKDWLNRHILVEDMAYRPYVEGRRQVAQVAEALGPGLFERDAEALRRRV